jgi:hypothetical protein
MWGEAACCSDFPHHRSCSGSGLRIGSTLPHRLPEGRQAWSAPLGPIREDDLGTSFGFGVVLFPAAPGNSFQQQPRGIPVEQMLHSLEILGSPNRRFVNQDGDGFDRFCSNCSEVRQSVIVFQAAEMQRGSRLPLEDHPCRFECANQTEVVFLPNDDGAQDEPSGASRAVGSEHEPLVARFVDIDSEGAFLHRLPDHTVAFDSPPPRGYHPLNSSLAMTSRAEPGHEHQ